MNVFGYEERDGKLVLHETETEIVKYIFEKYNVYCDNPPEDLVQAVIEECESRGEVITYEEAKKMVSYSAILQRITDEVNVRWKEYLSQSSEQAERMELYIEHIRKNKIRIENNEPIIDRQTWEKVRAARRKR